MKTKLYLTLGMLVFSTTMQCIASVALKHGTSASAEEGEAAAIVYLSTRDDARCSSYTTNPGEIESYKAPTQEISTFLSNKKNVNIKVHASKETKTDLIRILFGEKITHYKSGADYLLKDKLAENKLLVLDESAALDKDDPYYGHFRVLSLMNEITTKLVDDLFGNNFDIDTAISGVDKHLYSEIEHLSNITADMFRDCFKAAHAHHKAGIAKHIEKLKGTNIEQPLVIQSTVLVSSGDTHDVSAQSTGKNVGENPSSIGALATGLESAEVDEEEQLQIKEETGVVEQTSANLSEVSTNVAKFTPITTTQEVTAALTETKQKKDAYKSENGISKTKRADVDADKELTLLDAYRTRLKNFNSKATNPFEQINAAKQAYEDYMGTKSIKESTDGDTSRRSSNASDATASRKNSDAKPLVTRRSSFRIFG